MEAVYTTGEVAKILKISKATVYRLIYQGKLTGAKFSGKGRGGLLRFRENDLKRLFKNADKVGKD